VPQKRKARLHQLQEGGSNVVNIAPRPRGVLEMADKWARRLFTAGALFLVLLGLLHSLSMFKARAGA